MTELIAQSTISLRPQPVGIFPFPASFLLLPEMEAASAREALDALMRGDAQAAAQGEWRFYALALEGRVSEALEAIPGDGLLWEWNRFVLAPSTDAYNTLVHRLPLDMLPLLEAAAYAFGLSEAKPEAGELDGELRAMVLLTAASWHMEHEESAEAAALLSEALTDARGASPLLAAQILHPMAHAERGSSPAKAITHIKEAIRLADASALAALRVELWLNLGTTLQESANGSRPALLEASRAYQEAIRCGLSLEHLPEQYAFAQMNLALAYLAIPASEASDQLRMGIAVQGLREALKIFRRETHPEMWSSAQLNLANALQYLPSSHPQENLQQAVELYEELLEVRNKALDPLGYARLLANQANALAHLGIFQPALEKLNEAHKLFHWHGEPEMAAAALELTAEVNACLGARTSSRVEEGVS
jgi:tetratricopeptide (TPR) repeat protein